MEHQPTGILKHVWPSSGTEAPSTNLMLTRSMSSSSESGFESGSSYHSDEIGGSQPSTADSCESPVSECPGLCKWTSSPESKSMDYIKDVTHQLAQDVVNHMCDLSPCRHGTPYSSTMLRVVDDLSLRHEIVFESIVKRLGVDKSQDINAYQRTIAGVGEELFADGQYNWGRVVTMFAFSGWLARSCSKKLDTVHDSKNECSLFAATISSTTGQYMADKLSGWIYEQEGWDAMERFFAQPEPAESKLWRGLMFTFVGLGVLAAVAAVR